MKDIQMFKTDSGFIFYFYSEYKEYDNGDFSYRKVYHREDGPAKLNPDGTMIWFYHGEQINCSSQEEFEKILKLKSFW